MTGVLKQINTSPGGLPKRGVPEPIMLTSAGVAGDWQRNRKYHGGPDKAVLMISAEVLDDLSIKGFSVYPGALGENLTVSGLDPANWRFGQRYRIGEDAVVELTTLRTPCDNLKPYGTGIHAELYDAKCKAGNPNTPRWARGGFYARVVHGGLLVPGAEVVLQSDLA